MKINHAMRYASAISLALALSTAYAADTNTSSTAQPMTGKQKATAIGATTGAVAGAVVGGPVGAVAGAVVGGVVGHEGTDASGKVTSTDANGNKMASGASDSTVRSAQAALNDKGYNVGSVDGQWGPNTQSAVRQFQADKGLTQSGTLDSSTLAALGVNR